MLKAHASQMDGKPSALGLPVLTIDYTDFQNIQVIHDRLNGAKYERSMETSIWFLLLKNCNYNALALITCSSVRVAPQTW
jgi:hypothetical protein